MADPDFVKQFITLLTTHKWLALIALVVGLAVRLLKSPNAPSFIQRIPPTARPIVALGLGLLGGAIEQVLKGANWKTAVGEALFTGLFSAALSVFGHQVLIEWLRGGKEVLAPPAPTALEAAPSTNCEGQPVTKPEARE